MFTRYRKYRRPQGVIFQEEQKLPQLGLLMPAIIGVTSFVGSVTVKVLAKGP